MPPVVEGQRSAEFPSDITVVTVPVFVTDKNGKAVAGLQASDFEIADEGKTVPLVGFHEVDVDDPASEEALRGSLAGRRQFLLLFDLSFSDVSGLVRSRAAATEFVTRKMAATDLGAVATFSANHGVRLLVGFTSDRPQLKKAIETLGVLQLDRRADPLGLAYDLTDVGSALADEVPTRAPRRPASATPCAPSRSATRSRSRPSTASACWPSWTAWRSWPRRWTRYRGASR